MTDWMIITNPGAASATAGSAWQKAMNVFAQESLRYETSMTQHAGHAIDLAKEAAEKGYRKFIAAGGDGTIHEVMSGLLRYADEKEADLGEFTLGVLPCGTGNDWIRTAEIPSDVEEAARCIVRGNTGKEDIVRLTFENGVFCMANIGGVGLDADICYHTNSLKNRGYKGSFLYKLVAPYSIFSRKRRPVEIVCDGEPVYKGKMFTVVIGNGIYRGGGLKQNQEGGKWDDGQLEVSIQGDVNHIKGLQQMMHIFQGDFATLPGIITRRFRKMTLTPLGKGADRVESDGEIPGTLPLTIELTGQQINIIVP